MKDKAKCEAVAKYADGVGQEVRFYVDGECVKTLHIHRDHPTHGKYNVGETYTVDVDTSHEATNVERIGFPVPPVEEKPVVDTEEPEPGQ